MASPALRKRPDPARVAQLEALDDWTKEPAESTAAAVAAPPAEEVRAPAPVAPEPPPPAPSAPVRAKMPWEDLDPGVPRQLSVYLPSDLYVQMQWLAAQNFTSLKQELTNVLRAYATRELKERGYDVAGTEPG